MDKTKAKIQELCPDVMELKFGCAIIWDRPASETKSAKTLNAIVVGNLGNGVIDILWPGVNFAQRSSTIFKTSDSIKEILGSPITLAVVLRAIRTHHHRGNKYYDALPMVVRKWNLEHDNYDQQSDECKQFIGSLLTNEK